MQELEAPTLFKAFFKIRPESFDYCTVCLRAGSERRLVKPKSFKKFIEAIYLDFDFDEKSQVCYMCEQQASNAYKFYKAATFATTIKHLLQEYLEKRNMGKREVFEQRRFQQLIKRKKPPIEQWESQLQKVRSRSEMLHTEVLVIDSLGAHNPSPGKSSFTTEGLSEVYIVPDEPDELIKFQASKQASMTDTVILLDEDEESQLNNKAKPNLGPKLVPIQRLLDQPRIQSAEIIFDGFTDTPSDLLTSSATDNRLSTTSTVTLTQAPSVKEFVTTIPADRAHLATSASGIPTTTVNFPPSRVLGMNENLILHPIVLDKDGNLTVPSLQPTLVNNVIQMPQIANSNLLQINSEDTSNLNNILRLGQGANNSNLIHVNGTADRNNMLNLQISNNTSFNVQLSHGNIAILNKPNEVFQIPNPNSSTQKLFNVVSDNQNTELIKAADHLKQIKDLANEIKCEAEQYNTVNSDDVSVNKKSAIKSNIIDNIGIKRTNDAMKAVEDVHSTGKKKKMKEGEEKLPTKKNDRIDWEDKIPMDVISFVDAIDPNANKMLNEKRSPSPQDANKMRKKQRSPSPQYAITEVRSLNTCATDKRKKTLINIIDLS